ncbi:tRNA pseudouridine(55) synthase TruB, partial [Candidatus Parcubacteria bacterium]|nr:tRNA pseudouridine(55) synthase TruB [Candidatus Parcubacteria bacterium]
LGIGRSATKRLGEFQKLNKEYIAKLRLGAVSNTFDAEGEILEKKVKKIPTIKEIENVLKEFLGKIKQIPPPFSAKKIKGKKAYELARKGKIVKLSPIEVEIYNIEILNYSFPYLEIKVNCSSGTYIRSLANDIGEKLGCGALVEELKRTKIGNFSIENALSLERLNSENWKDFIFSDTMENNQ